MATETTGTLNTQSGTLFYETAGDGQAMVFLHAAIADRRMWDAQWQTFAKDYKVIRYDRVGFGDASAAEGPVMHRADLAALLAELQIDKAYLVGCSAGSDLALDFVLDHPDAVLGLVLASGTPSGFEMQGAPPEGIMDMIGALQAGDVEKAADLQVRVIGVGTQRTPDQVDAEFQRDLHDMALNALKKGSTAAEEAEPLDPPAIGRLYDVHVPTLVIVGELDHSELHRGGDLIADGVPHAKRVTISGTGHFPNMEKPDEFNKVVLEFLAEA